MKTLKFKWEDKKIYIYTFNSFNDDIRDYDVYINYLNENYKKFDFTKVDKFVDYIYEIIDDMDYVFIEGLEDDELEFYKSNLTYVYYDEILYYGDNVPKIYTKYLFDIRNKKNKKILKNNIKFNLCDEYQDVMIVDTDRKYILNDDSRGPNVVKVADGYVFENKKPYYYYFVKDATIQLVLSQQDGYIHDYRDIDELYFLRRKDLELRNKNYDTYDYTKFSDNINDDMYINYIYDIINDFDYVFIDRLSHDKECDYKNKLNCTYYDKILLKDKSKDFDADYIFDIRDKESKQFIKNEIKFNLSNKDKEPILVESDKKYKFNEMGREEYEYIDYCFIKDDYLEIVLHQKDGYIDDYRPTSLIEKSLDKYRG